MTRRRFLSTLAGMAPVSAIAATGRRPAGTIDVKELGAFGNGKLPDLRQIREAIRLASERAAGATIFFPPGDYFLGPADDTVLLDGQGLRNVRFVGEGATLSCRSIAGQSTMLQLSGCRGVTIEGINFRDHGLKREINWLGSAAVRLANFEASACEEIQIRNCGFDSVLAALVCRKADDHSQRRCTEIRLSELTVTRSYYGFNFQGNGDHVIGRGLRCNDVKRSYFPFGVSNHDIELETVNNVTGFTDVLIKCYHRDTSRIKAKVKCRGKRGGDARTGVLLSSATAETSQVSVLVTSSVAGEGKTAMAVNLALAQAQGRRVLLIDADLRRPSIQSTLGLDPGRPGLTQLLSGSATFAECLQRVEGTSLYAITSGPVPLNPLELMLSKRFAALIKAVAGTCDMLIIDSPPIHLVSDALVLSKMVNGVVFVVKADSTPYPLVRRCIHALNQVDAKLFGVTLNQLDLKRADRYYGAYGGGYYNTGTSKDGVAALRS